MKHNFKHYCYDADALLRGVTRFGEFKRNLRSQAELHPQLFSPNEYKGNAFEAFVEVLITSGYFQSDLCLYDYRPEKDGAYGIDGFCIYKNNDSKKEMPAPVQIKYQDDGTTFLRESNLSTFGAYSLTKYGKKDVHMVLFTSADGIFEHTANMFNNMLNVFGHREICGFVDYNTEFWDMFRNEMT